MNAVSGETENSPFMYSITEDFRFMSGGPVVLLAILKMLSSWVQLPRNPTALLKESGIKRRWQHRKKSEYKPNGFVCVYILATSLINYISILDLYQRVAKDAKLYINDKDLTSTRVNRQRVSLNHPQNLTVCNDWRK